MKINNKLKKATKSFLLISAIITSISLQAAEFILFTLTTENNAANQKTAQDVMAHTLGIPISTRSNSTIQQAIIGDEIRIPTPNGKTYHIKVKNITRHKNGDISLIGSIDEIYQAIITYGKVGSYASINTPEGKYEIDIQAGKEWLLTPEHIKQLITVPFENDTVIPSFTHINKQNAPTNKQVPSPSSQAAPEAIATIDIMVLYTSELTTEKGGVNAVESKINQLISLSNQAYIDSEMFISLRLVHSEEIAADNGSYAGTSLSNLKDGNGVFSDILALRENKGADLVVLLRDFVSTHKTCGSAYLLGNKNTGTIPQYNREAGYGVIHSGSTPERRFCSDLSFPHELGHNFGFAHDRAHSGGTGLFSYSYGYDIPNKFATIMSYNRPEVSQFSNPNIVCNESSCDGNEPLGILEGGNSANNVKSGNNIRFDIAAFYETKAPTTPDCNGDNEVSILDVVCVINAVLNAN